MLVAFGIKCTAENRDAFKAIMKQAGKGANEVLGELLALHGKPTPGTTADAISNNRLAADYERRIAELKTKLEEAATFPVQQVDPETIHAECRQKITELENRPTGITLPQYAWIYSPGARKDRIQRC